MDGNESDDSDNGYEELQNVNNDEDSSSNVEVQGGGGGSQGPSGGSSSGSDDGDDNHNASDVSDNDSGEERPYDISIAASHSYLGPGLVSVAGGAGGAGGARGVEAGWRGRVPALAHHGAVFPGETVPMLLPHADDAALLVHAIRHDKLFGLLCPDEVGTKLSGYGVLCEVLMAGIDEEDEEPMSVTFKARAIHRFRLLRVPKLSVPMHAYTRVRCVEVAVLAEVAAREPLRARLASLDALRSASRLHASDTKHAPVQQRVRTMDAALTPWPLFVYDIFDFDRMRHSIHEYFKTIMLEHKLPEEPVSLSFWVASNLALAARDRLALFVVDNALLRLHMECQFINRKSVLCCSSCMTEIARREHIFAMSSEGVHSNYTNLGGYMHDILTVSQTSNVETSGMASAEYSWFPGYTWTVALCAACMAHVGWRFEALKRNLRPHKFYGLCRNYVQPAPAGTRTN